jgi:hypothetical protein
MSSKILAAVVGVALFGPMTAQATIVDGSFSGTLSSGTDTTGVFGTPGADLTNDAITGTFSYDTSLLSQSVVGSQNTATGTSLGALTVTITIGSFSHTFTDNTSSSVFLDDSSASEVTLMNANSGGGMSENFFLDASDLITPFILSTDLTAPFSTNDPFSSSGTFFINDTGPSVVAGGAFTLGTLTVQAVPEPTGLAVLMVGIGGIMARRTRVARRAVA